MVDVIQWNRSGEELVYTYPRTEFEWGSQLIVEESQRAV